jgi:hypothetical protein
MSDPSLPQPFHEHIIDSLMPRREVHILAGASGVGKSTLMFQLVDLLTNGEEVFGHPSHPVSIGYLCADRSDADLARTFERVRVKTQIPRYSIFTNDKFKDTHSATDAIRRLLLLHPEVNFVILDAVSTFVENVNSAREVGNFLKSLTALAQANNITILLIHHTAKTKKDSGYSTPREKMAGCGAWGGYSNLNLILDAKDSSDPSDPYRILYVCPRNSTNFTIDYMLDSEGMLIEIPKADDKQKPADRRAAQDEWLESQPETRFHVSDLHAGLDEPAQKTFYRIVGRWIDEGKLKRDKEKGYYVKCKPN